VHVILHINQSIQASGTRCDSHNSKATPTQTGCEGAHRHILADGAQHRASAPCRIPEIATSPVVIANFYGPATLQIMPLQICCPAACSHARHWLQTSQISLILASFHLSQGIISISCCDCGSCIATERKVQHLSGGIDIAYCSNPSRTACINAYLCVNLIPYCDIEQLIAVRGPSCTTQTTGWLHVGVELSLL
jgi:hypothetical protein